MKLFLLTGSPFKIQTAQQALDPYGIVVEPVRADIPEIQAHSSLEVARHTARQAADHLGHAVVREDHAFHIPALGGIPGPYMAYFERNLPPEKVLQLLADETDRSAYFDLGLVYVDPVNKVEHEFSYQVPLTIVEEMRGDVPELALGHDSVGWSPILQIVGENTTFAELPAHTRFHYFTKNFEALAQKLQAKK